MLGKIIDWISSIAGWRRRNILIIRDIFAVGNDIGRVYWRSKKGDSADKNQRKNECNDFFHMIYPFFVKAVYSDLNNMVIVVKRLSPMAMPEKTPFSWREILNKYF